MKFENSNSEYFKIFLDNILHTHIIYLFKDETAK